MCKHMPSYVHCSVDQNKKPHIFVRGKYQVKRIRSGLIYLQLLLFFISAVSSHLTFTFSLPGRNCQKQVEELRITAFHCQNVDKPIPQTCVLFSYNRNKIQVKRSKYGVSSPGKKDGLD